MRRSQHRGYRREGDRRRGWPSAPVVWLGGLIAAAGLCVWLGPWRGPDAPAPTGLTAASSDRPIAASDEETVPFGEHVAGVIRECGRVTVTLHVALADHRDSAVPMQFGDGGKPGGNFYWGALYGVDTHLANARGWRRAYTDDGRPGRAIRRTVFHRRAEPTPAWRSRGVTEGFDLYVLACAWPSSRAAAAMEQPLRDALSDGPVVLRVDGVDLAFGAGSVMTGYLGQNRMLDRYWDPFAGLRPRRLGRQMGIFYICSMSAVSLHRPVVDRGLYSVLFVRRPIVTEAYVVEGMLAALSAGELDDGFLIRAAEQYARHQKDTSPSQARPLFYR